MTATHVHGWHGLYEGVVVSAADPTGVGRLQVRVPEVLGNDAQVWAAPLTPLAGTDCGMYVVPPQDSGVWVRFLDGDPERAVCVGFRRRGSGDVPPVARPADPDVPQIVLATPSGHALIINDTPGAQGGIKLQLSNGRGPFIEITQKSIEISCGPGLATIRLEDRMATVNEDALRVQ
ncbi:phage baseplate assembly protein V [Streptomyces sp. NPDC017979]|uniref:phage baseplate assembly protein V n=1 Tax=Streptomyces sp. NPDC017979 TaxID=3365024 RepID=UPI00379DAE5A